MHAPMKEKKINIVGPLPISYQILLPAALQAAGVNRTESSI